MPEMTLLGWFHTILGILAVLSGFYTIYKYKVISSEVGSGKLYVLVTLLVAGSALGIYNQGGFGVAHVLAVLTLIALAGGLHHGAIQMVWIFFKVLSSIRLYLNIAVSYDSSYYRFSQKTAGWRSIH